MVCNQQKGSNSTSHLFDPSVNSQLPSTGEGGKRERQARGGVYHVANGQQLFTIYEKHSFQAIIHI